MFCKTLLVLVAVALVAQVADARSTKKKPTKAATTTTTKAPTTTTTIAATTTTTVAAPEAITTIWEDTEFVGEHVSGIERMLGAATRKFFDSIGYKYNTKAILENNLNYLLSSDWTPVYTKQDAEARYTLQQVIGNLHPLTNFFYDL